jgi:alpha-D-ribose 1-methylphosphonate 5-triphosphate diphosphatase
MIETVFTNARLVLRDQVIDGSLSVGDGCIRAVDPGRTSLPRAVDCGGDFLLPGLVELHTDNLEKHLVPRPAVAWPMRPALLAHDAQLLSAGITTAFDAVSIGDFENPVSPLAVSAALLDARESERLRIDHRLHLRCELPCPSLLEQLEPLLVVPNVGLISLMDHTPGQRQFGDLAAYRRYYGRHGAQWDEEAFMALVEQRRQMQGRYADRHAAQISALARQRGLALASHDDATAEHIQQARALGVNIAEFPINLETARAARGAGLVILAGAPNLVCGGSHSGNIAVSELALHGLLDVLSSDYAPASLLLGAFLLHHQFGQPLPHCIAGVSARPAQAVGLDDRGELQSGRRADLVRVKVVEGQACVEAVWVAGERRY